QAEDGIRDFHVTGVQTCALPILFPEHSGMTDRQRRNVQATRTQVRGIFANERNSKGYGANGWTMYNSVVEYLDHGRDADLNNRQIGRASCRERVKVAVRASVIST